MNTKPQKILLIGPESTGKTTLAMQLAQHFRTTWAPEFTRLYLEAKSAIYPESRLDELLKVDDIESLILGQMAQEQHLSIQARELLFCDAGTFSTEVYAQHYFGYTANWIREANTKNHYDLCLLCAPDLPWEADWQRVEPDRREELFNLFKTYLENRKAKFYIIEGHKDQRAKQAIQYLEEWQQAPPSY